MTFINTVKSHYNYYFYESAYPVLQNLPLVGGALNVTFLVVAYIFLIKVGLPTFMKNKPAYNLNKVISVYNTFQVIGNFIVCFGVSEQALSSGWLSIPNYHCASIEFYETYPHSSRMYYSMYGYFILKVSELIETGFFILRKKDKQASKFHMFHHISALILGWTCCNYAPFGPISLPIILNSFVHVIMYAYYQAVLVSNEVQKKWLAKYKPWLTKLQMIQLAIILSFCTYIIFSTCPAIKWVFFVSIPSTIVTIYLFIDFYVKNYIKYKNTLKKTP